MALGAYMAMHACSEERARAALIEAARHNRVGLGAVSQALIVVASGADRPDTASHALDYWREHVDLRQRMLDDDH